MIIDVITPDPPGIAFFQLHGFVVRSEGGEFQSIASFVEYYLGPVIVLFCSNHLLTPPPEMGPFDHAAERVVNLRDASISVCADDGFATDSEIGFFDYVSVVVEAPCPFCVALLSHDRF